MKKFKVISIFGTRPEAIKMAPLVLELKKRAIQFNNKLITKVIITAQHREMLDEVLEIFNIKADYDLNVMTKNQDLAKLTSKIIIGVTNILKSEMPDLVLVHGDTTTALASSLAAFYLKIPIGHVEAGLRTSTLNYPFPEEANRRLCDILSSFHYAPTVNAQNNLLKAGIPKDNIFITGNTIIDALNIILNSNKKINFDFINFTDSSYNKFPKIILVTAHRRENFGKPLEQIFDSLHEIVQKYEDVIIIYPVHPNPNVRETIENKYLTLNENIKKRIILKSPMSYVEFINLMKMAYIILTDSGGIQEEATMLSKPVLILRNETERPEIIEAGCGILVGTDKSVILKHVDMLLNSKDLYEKMSKGAKCFGDGTASIKICDLICNLANIK